jgi:heptose-I-phosphate ethanolaminephosphotransferase
LFFLSFGLSSFSGPFGAISSEYVIYLKQKADLKRMVEERKNGDFLKTFSVTSSDSSAKKVMVIIGESLNRKFMSLYGYPKNTTPNLVRLASDSSNGKLYYFTNIISPEATTVPALRKVLTNINNENNIPFDKCITIVDLFKKAGYESFWISNQEPMGKFDTPNAVIASSADHTYFTAYKNDIKNKNASTGDYFDSELFNVFNGFEAKSDNKKQVFFVHLMGSHFYYKDRYPASFNAFHSKKDMDTSSYLNTVYYNDYIVSHFIQLAQKNNFDVVCYFSDHGEDMKYQHNPENYTREMSSVPFLVFLSNPYRVKHPALNNDMDKNKNVKGMTDTFLQDIQLICGFKSSILNPTKAFVSGQYVFKKRKVVNNSIAYDK